jgi:hypothetical protein
VIQPYRSVVPSVHPSVWPADGAHVIGENEYLAARRTG